MNYPSQRLEELNPEIDEEDWQARRPRGKKRRKNGTQGCSVPQGADLPKGMLGGRKTDDGTLNEHM